MKVSSLAITEIDSIESALHITINCDEKPSRSRDQIIAIEDNKEFDYDHMSTQVYRNHWAEVEAHDAQIAKARQKAYEEEIKEIEEAKAYDAERDKLLSRSYVALDNELYEENVSAKHDQLSSRRKKHQEKQTIHYGKPIPKTTDAVRDNKFSNKLYGTKKESGFVSKTQKYIQKNWNDSVKAAGNSRRTAQAQKAREARQAREVRKVSRKAATSQSVLTKPSESGRYFRKVAKVARTAKASKVA